MNEHGKVCFCNARSAFLFAESTPESCIGKNFVELFGEEWATRRIDMLRQIIASGKPAISRHIRFGRRIQSTVRPLRLDDQDDQSFLVITVEGEHEPDDPSKFEIIESDVVHLGPLNTLTRRELEVLALVGHGLPTAQIASLMHRSPRTVERHLDSIRAKLNGANRVELAAFARRAGLRVEDADKARVN
ncbi:MAG: LuxR C-terminal-related transcriptional regulator [Planctomycetota bacterium]